MMDQLPSLAHASSAFPLGGPAIISDFDGTIVPFNVLNYLLEHLSVPNWQDFTRRWAQGEISQDEEYTLSFATVRASAAEMEAILATVPIDPSFPPFVEQCSQHRVPIAIASDGLRWYIEYILQRHNVRAVPIYACEIRFLDPGYHFEYPYFHTSTPLSGTSKRALVQAYRQDYDPVIYIGDGNNDYLAAEVADRVYARDRLLEISRQRALPAIAFDNFAGISAHLFGSALFEIADSQTC
jgi:2-hydroxy-3-keto-5-methylthiopentenyl-1-phosphate phosphatase